MFKSGNVTVMVSDFNKAIPFYVETLGFTLQHESDGHFAQLAAPGLTVGLLHVAGEQGAQSTSSSSVSIGLEVDDMAAAIQTLESRGVAFRDPVEGKAAQVVHFSDPDGNPLYLVCNR